MIGLTAGGKAVKGNLSDGVEIDSPQNTIGPGNVISGNLRGVNISGSDTIGTLVEGNLIGTDITGELDLGNATEGILIQNASDATIEGNATGSQVISGNNQGIVIPERRQPEPGRGQPDRHRQDRDCTRFPMPRKASRSRRSRQHHRRHDRSSLEPDLGQQLGCPARRLGRPTKQPGRGQPDRHRHHRQVAAGKRNQRRDHHRQCVEQHDRRDRRGRRATPSPSMLLRASPVGLGNR